VSCPGTDWCRRRHNKQRSPNDCLQGMPASREPLDPGVERRLSENSSDRSGSVCDVRDGSCARQQLLQASPVCPAVCDRVEDDPSGDARRVRKGKTTPWEGSVPCRRWRRRSTGHGRRVGCLRDGLGRSRAGRRRGPPVYLHWPAHGGGAAPRGPRLTPCRVPPGVCDAIWRAYAYRTLADERQTEVRPQDDRPDGVASCRIFGRGSDADAEKRKRVSGY
jgi:hypothetical protein